MDANGKVTNVNSTSEFRHAVITATAGGISIESIVYCHGIAASAPPSAEPPVASDPQPSQTPSGSGTITVGAKGKVVNAPNGVYVRVTPDPSRAPENTIASLRNGDSITVLEAVGDDWYKISFAGPNGTTEGYLMGECISTN